MTGLLFLFLSFFEEGIPLVEDRRVTLKQLEVQLSLSDRVLPQPVKALVSVLSSGRQKHISRSWWFIMACLLGGRCQKDPGVQGQPKLHRDQYPSPSKTKQNKQKNQVGRRKEKKYQRKIKHCSVNGTCRMYLSSSKINFLAGCGRACFLVLFPVVIKHLDKGKLVDGGGVFQLTSRFQSTLQGRQGGRNLKIVIFAVRNREK